MDSREKLTIKIPKPIMTLYAAEYMFDTKWFDSEEELLEHYNKKKQEQKEMEKKIKEQPEPISFWDKILVGADRLNATVPTLARYDYIGNFLGQSDVFRKRYYNSNKSEFLTFGFDTDHYSYLVFDSRKIFWNCEIGNLNSVYQAFQERKIEFKNEQYKKQMDISEGMGKQFVKEKKH